MKISLDSKVSLGFVLLCTIAHVFHYVLPDALFVSSGTVLLFSPFFYSGLLLHPFYHQDWSHLLSNLTFFIVVAPPVEFKYGCLRTMIFMLITSLFVGLSNAILFDTNLIGASGIVFGLIMLNSFANHKPNSIPVTPLLVALIYLGNELINSLSKDNVSQWAHLAGGLIGIVFGFIYEFSNNRWQSKNPKNGKI